MALEALVALLRIVNALLMHRVEHLLYGQLYLRARRLPAASLASGGQTGLQALVALVTLWGLV